jgi:hypothetical protein
MYIYIDVSLYVDSYIYGELSAVQDISVVQLYRSRVERWCKYVKKMIIERGLYGPDYSVVPFGHVEGFKRDDMSNFVRRLYNLYRGTRLTFKSLHLTYYFLSFVF